MEALEKVKRYPREDKRQTLFAARNKDMVGEVGGHTATSSGNVLMT